MLIMLMMKTMKCPHPDPNPKPKSVPSPALGSRETSAQHTSTLTQYSSRPGVWGQD